MPGNNAQPNLCLRCASEERLAREKRSARNFLFAILNGRRTRSARSQPTSDGRQVSPRVGGGGGRTGRSMSHGSRAEPRNENLFGNQIRTRGTGRRARWMRTQHCVPTPPLCASGCAATPPCAPRRWVDKWKKMCMCVWGGERNKNDQNINDTKRGTPPGRELPEPPRTHLASPPPAPPRSASAAENTEQAAVANRSARRHARSQ